jgi:VWFA-related protein
MRSFLREIEGRGRTFAIVAMTIVVSLTGGGAQDRDKPLRPTGLAPEHVEANLVLVDALVRDRNGAPVAGLKQEDFELLIDRLPAPIASFESDCVAAAGAAAPSAHPPAAVARAAEPRHVVLFFDISHLTRPGRDRSLEAALRWVREGMSDADSVMILAMKGRPILLEPFTSDRARIAAKLEAVKGDNEMIDLSVAEERLNMLDIVRRDCQSLDTLCQTRLNVALPYAMSEEAKARRSLEALKSLMPALAPIRGRKSLIYFSETLRDEPGLQYLILANTTPQAQGIDLKQTLQDLHKEANAAGVAFYPVFAAGLGEGSGSSFSDASTGRIGTGDTTLLARAGQAGEDGALGLETTLALETGGEALKRSNDLGKIFTTVDADQSCYYVLGYANPGPGDGKRHSIIVKTSAKGYEVRHRPYYEDLSESERLNRRFASALMAPEFFREIPATVNAFELAPTEKGTPILIKVEFPLSEVTLVGQAGGRRAGEIEVRGKVWTGSKEACKFGRRFPVSLEQGEATAERNVIYEAGCEVPPGNHDLTVAVLDGPSWEIGGAETPLPVKARAPGIAGDVVLWTSSSDDLLVAADATAVGIHDTGSGHGFVPKGERRFSARETALLYAIVCPPQAGTKTAPPPGAGAAPAGPAASESAPHVKVTRSVYLGEKVVASFPEIELGGSANATTVERGGCEGIFASIPPGRLRPGRYTYEVSVLGIAAEPIVRRAGFAVDAGTAAVEAPEPPTPGS